MGTRGGPLGGKERSRWEHKASRLQSLNLTVQLLLLTLREAPIALPFDGLKRKGSVMGRFLNISFTLIFVNKEQTRALRKPDVSHRKLGVLGTMVRPPGKGSGSGPPCGR